MRWHCGDEGSRIGVDPSAAQTPERASCWSRAASQGCPFVGWGGCRQECWPPGGWVTPTFRDLSGPAAGPRVVPVGRTDAETAHLVSTDHRRRPAGHPGQSDNRAGLAHDRRHLLPGDHRGTVRVPGGQGRLDHGARRGRRCVVGALVGHGRLRVRDAASALPGAGPVGWRTVRRDAAADGHRASDNGLRRGLADRGPRAAGVRGVRATEAAPQPARAEGRISVEARSAGCASRLRMAARIAADIR